MLAGFLSSGFEIRLTPDARRMDLKFVARKHSPASASRAKLGKYWALLAQVESLDHALVAVGSGVFQIIQKLAAPGDHLQQTPPRGMILHVGFEVVGQLVDAAGQQGDLHIGASCILRMHSQGLDFLSFSHGNNVSFRNLWGAKYGREIFDGKELFRVS
jgi:hypothetical protein